MSAELLADLGAAIFGLGAFAGAAAVMVIAEVTRRRPGLLEDTPGENGAGE